jgi:hypothetical protein
VPIDYAALGLDEPPAPDDLAKLLAKQLTAGKSREDLIRLAGLVIRNQAESEQEDQAPRAEGMPQTPDELWDYIVRRYGVRIARVAVCHDHDTPFDYVCAGFFKTYPNVFCIGPRGGGKSYDQLLLHDLNAHWKPGMRVGHLRRRRRASKTRLRRLQGLCRPRRDRWASRASPRPYYNPVEGMNYGSQGRSARSHPRRGKRPASSDGRHSDEVEIMRPESWRESRNLASARTTPDGRHIKAQNLATSTMKWKGGRVWQVLESFKRAKEKAIAQLGSAPENKPLVDDMVTKTTQFYVLSFCI